jgi:hypothetical protein
VTGYVWTHRAHGGRIPLYCAWPVD